MIFLSDKNGIAIINPHKVYVNVIQLLNYLFPYTNIVLLKRCPNLLIRPYLFPLVYGLSLSDLGRVPSEIWILNLRSELIFSRRVYVIDL
jgi:hypothetical protein